MAFLTSVTGKARPAPGRATQSAPAARRGLTALVSILMLLGSWAVLAYLLNDPTRAPSPAQILPILVSETLSGALPYQLGITLGRVAISFALAMLIGAALGLAMGTRARLNAWADPWLVVALNIPALVTIVLSYLWLGLGETAAIVAVVANKVPLVTVLVREGAKVIDPDLDEMAAAYRMSRGDRLRHLILPQLAPSLAGAARSGLALIWKIVLVVEFLGRGSGMGFKIHLYFQMFDIPRVIAYALAFIIVMLAIEWLVMQPLERAARRWRAP
ncbi:ABC transporter permease [Paracoccus xiamenensis]|uniref:ABC transporter permease n=1 Tax=Paracoccus xiamenensis TaxID=2714901 RepID=UPI0014074AEC|nr:ABC transporter permease [Paracoccus xiamenensis]NHF74491.1 ABC transporter permease [Paracoccus xiamenensis]